MDKNRSMVDVAYELMSKKKKAVNFYKLWQEVSEVKGFDEEEKEFSENVDSIFWKDYLGIIDDISGCTLYNYKNLKTTYYNSSVIGDIVDKYLKGDFSKGNF